VEAGATGGGVPASDLATTGEGVGVVETPVPDASAAELGAAAASRLRICARIVWRDASMADSMAWKVCCTRPRGVLKIARQRGSPKTGIRKRLRKVATNQGVGIFIRRMLRRSQYVKLC
jgi:hypothetical protein